MPFAVETYGRLGDAAERLLRQFAEVAASNGESTRDGFLVWLKRELSVALIKGNARMFSHYVGVMSSTVGHRFVPGELRQAFLFSRDGQITRDKKRVINNA